MKILVCIKQVPDIDANPEITEDSLYLKENNIAFRFNRYDECALEEALLIKDKFPDTVVDVVSAGPERAAAVLKKSLEKGADNVLLIKLDDPSSDPYVTASLISAYASSRNYDIIFTGVMSEDRMSAVVGPMIAAHLSIPCAVSVVKSEPDILEKKLVVETELEGGLIEEIQLTMPCLVAVQTGINLPRYPSLTNVLRAKKIDPSVYKAEEFNKGNLTERVSLSYPPENSKGALIEGTAEEKAEKLLVVLHDRGLLRAVPL